MRLIYVIFSTDLLCSRGKQMLPSRYRRGPVATSKRRNTCPYAVLSPEFNLWQEANGPENDLKICAEMLMLELFRFRKFQSFSKKFPMFSSLFTFWFHFDRNMLKGGLLEFIMQRRRGPLYCCKAVWDACMPRENWKN